ncbi:MAG: hypothetical protein K1X66_08745 [Verrucomicrobiae bacterium]|nr:hypothetical protein [Verrucomicrobiae bacterium]
MSVVEIKKAIDALSFEEKKILLNHLAEQFEDFLDLRISQEALAEGDFTNFEDLKKEMDAKFSGTQ